MARSGPDGPKTASGGCLGGETDARRIGTRKQLSSAIICGAGVSGRYGKGTCETRNHRVFQGERLSVAKTEARRGAPERAGLGTIAGDSKSYRAQTRTRKMPGSCLLHTDPTIPELIRDLLTVPDDSAGMAFWPCGLPDIGSRSPSRTRKRRARRAGRGAGFRSGIRVGRPLPGSGSGSPRGRAALDPSRKGAKRRGPRPGPRSAFRCRRFARSSPGSRAATGCVQRGFATDSDRSARHRCQTDFPMAAIGNADRVPAGKARGPCALSSPFASPH